jgi:2-polyprenyl-3-methyl-5-hydroxy-6-metoxy-1,4-benzoquinol methylase
MSETDSRPEATEISRFIREKRNAESSTQVFDLALFRELNQEYESRPVIPAPRHLDDGSRGDYAAHRARLLHDRLGIRGKRVLEIGCGAGDTSAEIARHYDCEVVAVDLFHYPSWTRLQVPGLRFVKGDLAEPSTAAMVASLGPFDRIFSMVVWEHVAHPFALLQAARDVLSPSGVFYLYANLYRSAVASHRYREVYFPWPHLLFGDDVFAAFYESIGKEVELPAWLNKLTFAQYLLYFEQLGLDVQQRWLATRPIDEAFYARFERQLAAYPRFDLGLDFFAFVLRRAPRGPLAGPVRAWRRLGVRVQNLLVRLRKSSGHDRD